MPLANPDTARTPRGIPVVIAVLANDEGGNLAISGYVQPTAGTLTLNPDQTFTYTPNAAFEGVDGFSYTVRDAVGGTSQGEVRVFVARPNTAPLAGDDSAAVTTGSAATIPALANDNDPDGDPIEIIGVDAPAHGTITVQPDGSIRYVPQTDFAGIDSFTYTIGDGQGATAEASVTIMVTLPNRPPVARADRTTTVEGSAVTIDVLANDNDPDGNPISLGGMEMPGQGSLALTPENRFTYTPRPGFVGVDSFSYTIRDDAGAAARAEVTVEVTARNAPPAAVPDSLASTGQAVAFDPLANDSDPDGDALQLKSLTMPLRGRVEVASDGQVTYTPPSGFTGTDGFTYQVGDGTAVSEAEVSVAVTAPAIPTYANGYRYRRRIVVPAQAAAAEVATDFVLLVQESGAWLKPASAGGRLEHAQGFDIRLELEGGAKLDHDIELYDGAAGSLIAWVRVPSYQLASQLRLLLYYGKPGLTVTEANPAGTWRGYLAVVDGRTGVDRTGNGRSLTPTGVGSGTLIGPAGAYSGTSVASRGDAAFLSGLNALTVQTLIRPDAAMVGSDHGVLAQGPMNGSDASAGLILQYLAQAADGTPNVVHFKVNAADGAAFVLSGAQTHAATRQLLHAVWAQGAVCQLFFDGVEADPSATSAARAGPTSMTAGGVYLGAGARDPATGGWRGLIDELRLTAVAFSPARVAAEAANLGALQTLYGLGGEDAAGQTDAAPTAVPLRTKAEAGSSVDVDVAASAYDPDGPAQMIVSAVGTPAKGVVTVVSGKVRYTPFAGFAGPDAFTYTLQNAGKQSSSIVLVEVASPADARPKHPPTPKRTLKVPEDYATFAQAYAAASGGDHISLANGTYTESFNLSRSFPSTNPVIIRSRSTTGAVPGARITGKITVGATGHWLYELQTDYTNSRRAEGDVNLNSNHTWITRCWIRGRHGVQCAANVHHIWVGWNRFTGRNTPTGTDGSGNPTSENCMQLKLQIPGDYKSPTAGPYEYYCYRNFFWDDTNHQLYTSEVGGESMSVYVGDAHPDQPTDMGRMLNVVFEENYFPAAANGHSRPRSIYVKRGCDIFRNRSTQRYGNFGQRHGWGSRIWGNRVAGSAFLVIGDEWAGSFANGADVRNNVSSAQIRLFRATQRPTDPERGGYQAAHWVTLYKNQAPLLVGYANLAGTLERVTSQGDKVRNVRIYNHSGTVTINSPTDADAATVTQNTGNPLALFDGAELISATFDGRDTGFETGDQGLA